MFTITLKHFVLIMYLVDCKWHIRLMFPQFCNEWYTLYEDDDISMTQWWLRASQHKQSSSRYLFLNTAEFCIEMMKEKHDIHSFHCVYKGSEKAVCLYKRNIELWFIIKDLYRTTLPNEIQLSIRHELIKTNTHQMFLIHLNIRFYKCTHIFSCIC